MNEEEHQSEAINPDNIDKDLHLQCQQCSEEFVFTASSQRFFLEMGFVTPRYCPECRKARKRDTTRTSDWQENYKVTCDRCSKETTVPFKPVNGRPVYCHECLIEVRRQTEPQLPEEQFSNEFYRWNSYSTRDFNGVGITRLEDAERPYADLEEDVQKILNRQFGEKQ
ncbi:zinc-ribbon domain containing protein [bacterium]|nr:zinc-ribbon domain containing protein [bacterium]